MCGPCDREENVTTKRKEITLRACRLRLLPDQCFNSLALLINFPDHHYCRYHHRCGHHCRHQSHAVAGLRTGQNFLQRYLSLSTSPLLHARVHSAPHLSPAILCSKRPTAQSSPFITMHTQRLKHGHSARLFPFSPTPVSTPTQASSRACRNQVMPLLKARLSTHPCTMVSAPPVLHRTH